MAVEVSWGLGLPLSANSSLDLDVDRSLHKQEGKRGLAGPWRGREAWRGPGGATKTDLSMKRRAEVVISQEGVLPVDSALNFSPACALPSLTKSKDLPITHWGVHGSGQIFGFDRFPANSENLCISND